MKTKDELNTLKEEVETLNRKLAELTDDELEQVSGGAILGYYDAIIDGLRRLHADPPYIELNDLEKSGN